MFVASHTMSWIISQPPAFSIYEANAHWHTHQCSTGQFEDASPSHSMDDEHQFDCPVVVQKLPPDVEERSMQMW